MNEPRPISHMIEKIRKNQWFIWKGNPRILDEREAIAGPFPTRIKALMAAQQLAMADLTSGAATAAANAQAVAEAARGH